MMVCISCSKFDTCVSGKIETLEIFDITESSAMSGGKITFKPRYNEAYVVDKGIIWSEREDDIIQGISGRCKINDASYSSKNYFECEMTDLKPMTTYYVRAFVVFLKNGEEITAYGDIRSFYLPAQVRFRKEKNYDHCLVMGIDSENDKELIYHDFGRASGISPYYEIPAGNHKPWYFDGEKYWYCLKPPSTYNFVVGRKYTVVCSDDGQYWTFYVTDDGLISKSDIAVKSAEPTKNNRIRNTTNPQNIKIK